MNNLKNIIEAYRSGADKGLLEAFRCVHNGQAAIRNSMQQINTFF